MKKEELWNLDATIAKFVLPRLVEYKKICNSRPPRLSMNEWYEILDKIIYAMSWVIKDYYGIHPWDDGDSSEICNEKIKNHDKKNERGADVIR